MKIGNCERIGGMRGNLLESDLRDQGGVYVWLTVDINVGDPHPSGFALKMKNGLEKWIDFKFERLPNFCFNCGGMDGVRDEVL